MAELTIDAKDIAAVLRKNVEDFRPGVERETVGRVLENGDGIARVAGLPNAAVNELLDVAVSDYLDWGAIALLRKECES